ncbi:hypothetical protein ACFU98_29400 [Streptomyces sp. NPDC057575]|uniref:hypothetical protein n=1 Tax=unclassified Streptomyces TaxID=2593676 RepID=UPI003686CF02
MALTSPTYTNKASRCVVSIQSIDRDIRITVPLNADQVAAWEDQDLTSRVDDLIAAIKGFLVVGEALHVDVAWEGTGRAEIIASDQVIEAPEEPAS